MKILITGAKGQLGQAFQKKFEQLNIQYIAKGSKELDITKIDRQGDIINIYTNFEFRLLLVASLI